MTVLNRCLGFGLWLGVATLVLTACSSKSLNHAPVEERMSRAGQPVGTSQPSVPQVAVKQPQGFENAGKPGYYTVKPGDTMIRIALDNGQTTQDVARWSQVDNPNRIEVGQVLRVAPPGGGDVVVKPVAKPVVSATATGPVVASSAPAAANTKAVATTDTEINWVWPASGAVLTGFDEVKNKGLDIGGVAGEPVLAAADGRVVYVGAGLRGYGNLIILKHNNVYLTAYAHNQTLLVKEDQSVQQGQKIAEMGNSDSDRVKLHFEVRRQGKPVDPVKYLPSR
jgi:lipoprotein NlpD